MRSPAFQFYPDDFIGGTVDLSAKEVGHYIRLICYQWGHGSIPKEKPLLARIAGGEISKAVLSKFPKGKNQRLEQERRKQLVWREKSRIGGQHSAAARAKGGLTTLQPPLQQKSQQCLQPNANSPSPSPSPSPIEREQEARAHFPEAEIPSWDEFWAYCQQQRLVAEWYAKDKWLSAQAENWRKAPNWRAYVQRCFSWWESDGRPMKRPVKVNGKYEQPKKSLLEKELERI